VHISFGIRSRSSVQDIFEPWVKRFHKKPGTMILFVVAVVLSSIVLDIG
jgi:hypothetical protein